MAFRFFRRLKIAPGLSVNLSKSGASLSAGPRGAKVTAGTSGVRRSVGVPGTGMYWYDQSSGGGKSRKGSRNSRATTADQANAGPRVRPEDRLHLGFFQRLFIDPGEEAFVDGMKAYVTGHPTRAYHQLRQADGVADAAFLAGMLAIDRDRLHEAETFLLKAKQCHQALGNQFEKYGITASISLYITDHVAALISPDLRGIRLALAEIYQDQHRPDKALKMLRQIHREAPDDVIIRLSLAELMMEEGGGKRTCKQVVGLVQDVDNESAIHAALLLYKARALRKLGLPTAARDALTTAFRRKKDRPDDLLRQIQYDRALVYEDLGRRSRSRGELEKIYAQAPDFEDVAERLDLET